MKIAAGTPWRKGPRKGQLHQRLRNVHPEDLENAFMGLVDVGSYRRNRQ